MTSPSMIISHVKTAREARALLAEGFCPVECSFGPESVVDDLRMDHHGQLAYLESVAVGAYRDHYGVRACDPRFVVTGAADADATFAIASLAGLVPAPQRAGMDRSVAGFNPISLAELIHHADVAPLGLRLEAHPQGGRLLLFRLLHTGAEDSLSFYAGADRWRRLCRPDVPASLIRAAVAEEQHRVEAARAAMVELVSDHVALVTSPVWGFDVWYAEVRPVIVAFVQATGRLTIGVRDEATAEDLIGAGGLLRVFPQLEPAGWGGRSAVGGSPRGATLAFEHGQRAAHTVAAPIVRHLADKHEHSSDSVPQSESSAVPRVDQIHVACPPTASALLVRLCATLDRNVTSAWR